MIRRLILALALSAGLAPAFAQVAPPVPALPDSERRTSYSITASTCACSVGFQLYGDSTDYANWIEVFVNGVRMAQAGNWTLSSVTGTIGSIPLPITNAVLTFTAPQTGTIQIVGARRPRRTSQFNEGAGVPTRNFNVVLSDLTAQNRELWDKTNDVTGRALMSQPGNTISMLPLPSVCAGKFLSFDGTGLIPLCLAGGVGSGNVVGPVSSTVGHVAFWNNTTGSLLSDGGTVRSIIPSTSYFVDDINGNDSNACTSATTGACKTLNGVVARIGAFDLGGQNITVSVAAPAVSYAGMACLRPWVGEGTVTFTGNTTTPTSVLVAGGASPAFDIENDCNVSLRGFSVSSTANQTIQGILSGKIFMSKMDLAGAASGLPSVYSTRDSYVEINDTIGATTIHTGTLAAQLFQASHSGELRIVCTTACLSFTANSTYTQQVILTDGGAVIATPSASFALNGFTVTGIQSKSMSYGHIQWNGNAPPAESAIPGTANSTLTLLGSLSTGPTVVSSGTLGSASSSLLIPGGTLGVCFQKQDNTQNTFCVDNSGVATFGLAPLPIASGGTNAITAAAARTNLGVTATGADTTYNFRANNLSDVASAATARVNLGLTTGQYPGTATNDSATSGNVGELLNASIASGSAVALTTNVAANVTSVSLTAGDWDVSGVVALLPGGTTTTSFLAAGITTTTAALPATLGSGSGNERLECWPANINTAAGFAPPWCSIGPTRISLASTTTVFLVTFATFAVSTNAAYGFIRARRMR